MVADAAGAASCLHHDVDRIRSPQALRLHDQEWRCAWSERTQIERGGSAETRRCTRRRCCLG